MTVIVCINSYFLPFSTSTRSCPQETGDASFWWLEMYLLVGKDWGICRLEGPIWHFQSGIWGAASDSFLVLWVPFWSLGQLIITSEDLQANRVWQVESQCGWEAVALSGGGSCPGRAEQDNWVSVHISGLSNLIVKEGFNSLNLRHLLRGCWQAGLVFPVCLKAGERNRHI